MASDSEETSSKRQPRNAGMPAKYGDYVMGGDLASNDDEAHDSRESDIGSAVTPKQRLDVTVRALERENERIEHELRLNQLILKNQELKDKLQESKPVPKKTKHESLTLKDLKANKTFKEHASKAEKDIVGQIFQETDSESSQSEESEGETCNKLNMLTLQYSKFKPKKNKSLSKSGASRKASDRAIYHVAWPHEYSGSEDIDYSSLSIPALVRGETYIIHHIEPDCYTQGRADHLN